MRWLLPAALCAAFITFRFAPQRIAQVHAGTAVRMSLSDLVQRAELAFEGRVLSLHARRAGDRVETEVSLRVERTFLGEPCDLQVVRLPGGVLPDGSGLILPGMPRLSLGEDVVLFLSRETVRGTRMPIGLAQGKLRVVRGADGGKRLVGDAAHVALVGAAPAAVPQGAGIAWDSALSEIESGLAARAAGVRR